jgi:cytochrome c oxidase subunit 2
MSRHTLLRLAAALAPAALALAACRGVQTPLDPAADQARDIDMVWRTMLVVCGIMYLLVMAFLAWALWRARRTSDGGAPVTGETPAEPGLRRGLTGWTALIASGLVVLTTVSFLVDRSIAEQGPKPLKVKVTANQWWWAVEYEGDTPAERVTTANEVHLPKDRPAVIELTSNDVIHSFWVPNLAGKMDLIPGRTNYVAVTPRRLGAFRGQCAEFCGWEHAKMAFEVKVDDAAGFEAWKARQRTPAAPAMDPEAIVGQQLFATRACVMCHRIAGTDAGGAVGPDLTHLKSRSHIAAGTLPNDRGSLQAWIADPQAFKPGAKMPRVDLTAPELNAIVAYLETLR